MDKTSFNVKILECDYLHLCETYFSDESKWSSHEKMNALLGWIVTFSILQCSKIPARHGIFPVELI